MVPSRKGSGAGSGGAEHKEEREAREFGAEDGVPQGPSPPPSGGGRFRNWIITEFVEAKVETAEWFGRRVAACPWVVYTIGQLENCPTADVRGQRQIHWQGYIEFNRPVRLKSVQVILSRVLGRDLRGHYEGRTGSQARAISYCSKAQTRIGEFCEFGKRKWKGKRSDLSDIAKCIREGRDGKFISWAYPGQWIRYRGGIMDLIFRRNKRRLNMHVNNMEAFILVGPTRCGKTRAVFEKYGVQNVFAPKIDNGCIWFNGYESHPVLLWDDYRGELPLSRFLQLTDKYIQQLPAKYGHDISNWSVIIVTSNDHPIGWYPEASQQSKEALLARFEVINGRDEVAEWRRRDEN